MQTNKSLHISKIYGFPVISSRERDLLDRLFGKNEFEAEKKGPVLVFTPNPEMVVLAGSNKAFLEALMTSEYNIPDGVGLVWLSRIATILGLLSKDQVIGKRVSGADFAWRVLEEMDKKRGSVFLLGASSRSNIKAQLEVKRAFPELSVSGEPGYIQSGFDDKDETGRIVKLINKFEPDLLLVAFGQVKQELWLTQNRSKLKARIAMGVGGTFDYWSGEKKRAPEMLRSTGLEWLWRLCIEPRRAMRIARAVFVFPFVGMRLILQNR